MSRNPSFLRCKCYDGRGLPESINWRGHLTDRHSSPVVLGGFWITSALGRVNSYTGQCRDKANHNWKLDEALRWIWKCFNNFRLRQSICERRYGRTKCLSSSDNGFLHHIMHIHICKINSIHKKHPTKSWAGPTDKTKAIDIRMAAKYATVFYFIFFQ